MSASRAPHARELATALRMAERLLTRAQAELSLVDRSSELAVRDRCLERILDTIGRLTRASARGDAGGVSDELVAGRELLGEAEWALGWIRRRRSIAPPAYNSLVVGLRAVTRRIEAASREIARSAVR